MAGGMSLGWALRGNGDSANGTHSSKALALARTKREAILRPEVNDLLLGNVAVNGDLDGCVTWRRGHSRNDGAHIAGYHQRFRGGGGASGESQSHKPER
jgi:hypothetical protein